MKKRFITRRDKNNKKNIILVLIIMFLIGIVLGFKYLNSSNIKIDDKYYANILLINPLSKKKDLIQKRYIKTITNYLKRPLNYLENNYIDIKTTPTLKEEKETIILPLVYIYNTHQTEEYLPTSYAEFSVNPTVMMADYILQDTLKKNNINSIVEERSIMNVLNEKKWNYSNSYKVSRIYLEDTYINNPTLKYFIDIHRDSLEKDRTTISINNKSYAKLLFIIGLENPNYTKNLEFTLKINNIIDNKYPGLSKGIYKKGGEGVNGIYNQDFQNTTILIEIGGFENNTTEILNSTLAFSECFMEAINEKTVA